MLEHVPGLTVDVHKPEHRLQIEIRDNAYMYVDNFMGVGGMPLGTGGRAALLLSGGIDSPVAGYMIMTVSYTHLDVYKRQAYTRHPKLGYFHPVQHYYKGTLLSQTQAPIEKDHELVWIEYSELRNNLFVEMQNWAAEQCWMSHQAENR